VVTHIKFKTILDVKWWPFEGIMQSRDWKLNITQTITNLK